MARKGFATSKTGLIVLAAALAGAVGASKDAGESDAQVGIDVVFKPEQCEQEAQDGDKLSVHYELKLEGSGKVIDASRTRGKPLDFTLGSGMVIKGWELGIKGMCPGEKRNLRIPPELGYGNRNMGPIPGGSTLLFETEMVAINRPSADQDL